MVVIHQDKIVEKSSDYIVVGGGASGCALTNKLLNANQSVTLIEAGSVSYTHLTLPTNGCV